MDLKSRLRDSRIQLPTDGLGHYLRVVDGLRAKKIDFAMLHKIYGAGKDGKGPERRHSTEERTGIDIRVITGDPDMRRVSMSYVERQKLTMSMGLRRFTRLTNGFSKKIKFHAHAMSLNFMHYNFVRPHLSLGAKNFDDTYIERSPEMAAGITNHLWSTLEIADLLE